jgi:hypothetical protein
MTADDELISKLEQWALARGIPPGSRFACPHYQQCQESRSSLNYPLLRAGDTCMMGYVGRCYGDVISGKPFRLVIVGMDHRDSESGSFADRQAGIEDWYYVQRRRFNSHYAGLVKTAAAVLGEAGQYCFANCCNERRCAGESRPTSARCTLLSFSQPNLVKCVSAPSGDCLATSEMYQHCSSHLVSELEVLRPHLLAFHGGPARWIFKQAVKDAGERLTSCDGPEDKYGPVIHELTGKLQSFVLFLAHPTRGWLDRQWKPVVEKALGWLRGRGVIPS